MFKSKKNFVTKEETEIIVDALKQNIDFQLKITRSKFEEISGNILNRAIEILHDVVNDLGLAKNDIDDIILIGGCSSIPKIKKLISIYFDGKYIRENLDFNAIACGAAVQAALLSGFNDGIIGNIKYKDIATFSIGL